MGVLDGRLDGSVLGFDSGFDEGCVAVFSPSEETNEGKDKIVVSSLNEGGKGEGEQEETEEARKVEPERNSRKHQEHATSNDPEQRRQRSRDPKQGQAENEESGVEGFLSDDVFSYLHGLGSCERWRKGRRRSG